MAQYCFCDERHGKSAWVRCWTSAWRCLHFERQLAILLLHDGEHQLGPVDGFHLVSSGSSSRRAKQKVANQIDKGHRLGRCDSYERRAGYASLRPGYDVFIIQTSRGAPNHRTVGSLGRPHRHVLLVDALPGSSRQASPYPEQGLAELGFYVCLSRNLPMLRGYDCNRVLYHALVSASHVKMDRRLAMY